MKKIFISGGAGFIGSHTVDAFIAQGDAVTVFDLKSWSDATNLHSVKEKISYIQGDIRDRHALVEAVKGHTHVLHLAAVVSVPETIKDPMYSHDVNVTGTLNVFEAGRTHAVTKIVYASSAAVYGHQHQLPIHESMTTAPQSPYGVQKAMCDTYAALYTQLYGLSIIGLRYFNVYGQRQDPLSPYSGVISKFVQIACSRKPITIYGDGHSSRDFVQVKDIVEANILALGSGSVGVYNIGTGKEVSLLQLVNTLETILGVPLVVEHVSSREGDIRRSVADIREASKLLGYVPRVSLETGLKDLI
jgi:UDP-glucose 4-epimerase